MSGAVTRGRSLLIAALAVLVGGVSFAVGVGSLLGQQAEASVLDAAEFTMNPPAPLRLVSLWTVGAAIFALTLLSWGVHGVGRAVRFVICACGALAVSQVLKQYLLERPSLFDFDAPNTFPSGHMTVFAVVCGGLIWAVNARWRPWAAVAASALMCVVSWQLLQFGWHRPSDVLGAQALGVLAFALAASLRSTKSNARAYRREKFTGTTSRIIASLFTVTGIIVAVAGISLAVLAASMRSAELMLLAGQVSLCGTSLIAVRLFTVLAR